MQETNAGLCTTCIYIYMTVCVFIYARVMYKGVSKWIEER